MEPVLLRTVSAGSLKPVVIGSMEPARTVRSSTVQESREGVAGAMGAMVNSAALPPVAAAIFSASVGGGGPAATQEAGWASTPAGGLAKLTFLTSISVASGLPGMAISSLRTSPYLPSTHTLAGVGMPSTDTSITLAAIPLTVPEPRSFGGFLAAFLLISAVMANGSPQSPEKLAPVHGPPGSNRSWV